MPVERVAIPGSARTPVPNATQVGKPDPNQIIQVTILLRRRTQRPLPRPGYSVGREEFAERYGADPEDVKKVERFAAQYNLTIMGVDLPRRSVVLSGRIANMTEAFATDLLVYQHVGGNFLGRTGELFIHSDLEGIVQSVHGLDDRPQARPHFRRNKPHARAAATGDISYTPNLVARLYDYPLSDGAGQTVGIIELGGGYTAADLTAYFQQLGLKQPPSVVAVGVDSASNQPAGDPNSADGEVLLDIEVIGAIAPAANIVVYFGPNTDQGFLDAITTAIHDKTHNPSVISISWGGPESTWTQQSLQSYDQAFQDAGALGVSVCVASGDGGSDDGVGDGQAHVDFPASSPNVLACGGTRLESANGLITNEVVWNSGASGGAGGGGVSEIFPLPAYQANAGVPVSVNSSHFAGRGVPDVSGDADPATGYEIRVDGQDAVFGGTSAVAPLWAALIAIFNQNLGKSMGFLNPALYSTAAGTTGFHDITSGNNGAYSAGPGWDACTGLGSPDGAELLTILSS
jgi:kumamolisin